MLLAGHLTALRALVQAVSTLSVKTRHAPSRHCTDARVYGHTTTAMHDIEYISANEYLVHPPPPTSIVYHYLITAAERGIDLEEFFYQQLRLLYNVWRLSIKSKASGPRVKRTRCSRTRKEAHALQEETTGQRSSLQLTFACPILLHPRPPYRAQKKLRAIYEHIKFRPDLR